jgi:ABC-type uncharacterized transport system substrate-binding protein
MKERIKRHPNLYSLLVVTLLLVFYSCANNIVNKKKVVYVNSYHSSFPPSAQITEGIFESLPSDSFEISVYFMDTKRNPSELFIKKRVAELLDSIQNDKPDVLIVSDDNAMKYLLLPNMNTLEVPAVFCGVNWSVEQYRPLPHELTGILEILPLEKLIQTLKPYYPEMKNLLVLNENTTTSRKTKPLLDTLLNNQKIHVVQKLVNDFESWKTAFIEANQEYDIIYLQTRGAIKNWDHEEALRIIEEHIKVPLVTCEEFMMPYAVFGLTQLSKEQGLWAGGAAKEIVEGKHPSAIPISKNKLAKVWLNEELAEKIGFYPDSALLKQVELTATSFKKEE